MPWVRLHGTKDYLDMVKILEAFPTIHQTFNVVPSLIDQLEEYLPPQHRSDAYLELSRKLVSDLTESDKRFLLEWFFTANWDRMVKPYPRYYDLLMKRGSAIHEQAWPEVIKRFKPQDYLDLQVWFNLAWIDPWLRQQDPALAQLEAKGSQFTEADKQRVLDKQLEILQRIIPTYHEAQARGQIELTCSPYYHPIMPLLCDLRSAQMALPHLALPNVPFRHPEDAAWHLQQALTRHEAVFGRTAAGLWPSEGSVSEDVVRLAMAKHLRWIATDEEILWRTLNSPRSLSLLYRPHLVRRKEGRLSMIFRDRELSDLLGFVYSQWNVSMAIQDFLKRLEGIYQQFRAEKTPALVSLILDGENAWESYHRDGHEFLMGLYHALAADSRFRLVTVSEFLDQFPLDQTPSLPEVRAGSWIDGNFATWIGHPEKNTAWTHLANVRADLTTAEHRGGQDPEPLKRAWHSFYIAEGSDWMWWFGDTHSSAQDQEFDRLFRLHLANVYRFLGQDAPAWLQVPIKTKALAPTYEPTALFTPVIDGRDTSYYEWLYAGRLDLRKGYAAIHRAQQALEMLYYGFDRHHYYFRLDVSPAQWTPLTKWKLQIEFLTHHLDVHIQRIPPASVEATAHSQNAKLKLVCAYQRVLEFAVPKTCLPVKPGEACHLRLTLYQDGALLERHPAQGVFRIPIPQADFEVESWSV